jgi:hypothetical protein
MQAFPVEGFMFSNPREPEETKVARKLTEPPDDVLLVTTSSDRGAAVSRDAAPVGL